MAYKIGFIRRQNIIKGFSVLFILIASCATAKDIYPEPKSWKFPDIVEEARKSSPNNIEGKPFNQFGLVYSKEQLSKVNFATASSIELQKYADIVTHAYTDALAKQLPKTCDNIPVNRLNETSIANFAYIANNALLSSTREQAKSCLSIIQSKLQQLHYVSV